MCRLVFFYGGSISFSDLGIVHIGSFLYLRCSQTQRADKAGKMSMFIDISGEPGEVDGV